MPTTDHRQRMLAGVPATARTIDIDDTATAIIEGGDGPPLLLHGSIECGGAMWTPVLTGSPSTTQVVVPDIPGLGESAPVAHLDVDTFGRWLTALVDQLALQQPTVGAYSLIGSLATRFATRKTGVIGRLVINAAPAVGAYRMPLRLGLRRHPLRDPRQRPQCRALRPLRAARPRRHPPTRP